MPIKSHGIDRVKCGNGLLAIIKAIVWIITAQKPTPSCCLLLTMITTTTTDCIESHVNSMEEKCDHEASVLMRPQRTASANKAATMVIGIEICKFRTYHAYAEVVSNHLGFC